MIFSGTDSIVFGDETRIFFFTFAFFSGIKYDKLIQEKGCFLFNKEEIFRFQLTAVLEND